MKLRPEVRNIMKVLDIAKLRKNQIKPINAILDGRDTFITAATSFGKSLIYQIPAIIRYDTLTIVIEPLLALMHDQVDKLQRHGVSAAYLDSTQSYLEQDDVIDALGNQSIRILYLSPERLESGILSIAAESNQIGMVVVDECHCVTTWGYSFRHSYLKIGHYISGLDYHPVIVALSATAMPEDKPEIMRLLAMQNVKNFSFSLYRSNLSFMKQIASTRKEKQKLLKKYMKKFHKHTTIIFCATKRDVEAVAIYLEGLYPNDVIAYHSEKKDEEKALLSGTKHIIVATSALSMGVDVPNVDLVIHFNMPPSLAEYYQMAGRSGREGQRARSILLYSADDYYTNRRLLRKTTGEFTYRLALKRLDAMKEFCDDTKQCMVKSLLHTLGDAHDKNCRYCTNCQKVR